MSAELSPRDPARTSELPGYLPEGEDLVRNVAGRQRSGRVWQGVLIGSTLVGLVVLLMLLFNIANDAFGGIALESAIDEQELTGGRPLEELSSAELVTIVEENVSRRILRNLTRNQELSAYSDDELLEVIYAEVLELEVVRTYPLSTYLFQRDQILTELAESNPRAELEFRSWVSRDFVASPMSSNPLIAGLRTAIMGTLWVLLLTILVAFPLGIGAAIYLEEYQSEKPFSERSAAGRWLNGAFRRISSLIQLNIYNLSGVPSIIYGMLGLSIFVIALVQLTSGVLVGATDPGTANGRTILSAGLTMALLVMPVVIIASQEAIRAVPSSLRQASYGLGATKWQTIWRIVLPNALPGILTGTILAVSRAIGETAPLIVVGASTFIVTDPTGFFSKFTVLPIQIYNWTSRPQAEFRSIAAAAIVVLLTMLLTVNAAAILLRNYVRSRRIV
ncbi:MAG TPA: phosphate ABC transporter permease PstA [Chloroflexaceae bacterium]|nr:phosphate ABC transporter permease PstA [Chloroflexaceae bacterium]